MNDRAQHYRDRCRADGKVNIIQPNGVKSIGKLRFIDGMLYIGRKKHGPYLVQKNFGNSELVVRYAEASNAHRVEALRWKLLLRIQQFGERRAKTISRLKELAVRKRVVGFYKDRWHRLQFQDESISQEILSFDETNVLDAMVTLGRSVEEHELVARYLQLADLLEKYLGTVATISNVLQSILQSHNPNKRFFSRDNAISVTVNGRTYICVRGHYPPDAPDRGWPSPMIQHIDLDIARYGAAVTA
jgi:hypothetical protein